MSQSVIHSQPIRACFSDTKEKPLGREIHKQAVTKGPSSASQGRKQTSDSQWLQRIFIQVLETILHQLLLNLKMWAMCKHGFNTKQLMQYVS